MNLFQIKICGITTLQDANDALGCGADAIGLNFYHGSPRFVNDEVAKTIRNSNAAKNESVRKSLSDAKTANPKFVGVFVNTPVSEVVRKAVALNLDGIQLHGDEKPSVVLEINRQLRGYGHPCDLIRAIRNRPVEDPQADRHLELARVEAEIGAWTDVGIDAILLDAAVPGEFGGTGKVLDWEMVPRLSQNVPLILAGGLNPGNVADAIGISKVSAVDVASGVESKPGHKDHAKVKAFVAAAKRVLG